jgi:serine/threonine-protein kinase
MTGSIVGTPHYMSPEQVQGQPVDGRSDQFSLAVIAFEMLTGEKPYTGEHLTTVVYKIVAEEPPSPQRINASLGSAIENVLRKGLAKKPDARYASCQEFTEALEKACAASKGWQSLPRGGSLNAPTVVDKQTLSAPVLPPARRARRADLTASSTTERTSRRRSGFLPFLAAILMAAALLAVVAWQVKPAETFRPSGVAKTADAHGRSAGGRRSYRGSRPAR